jgi:hypothetical protein
MDRVEGFFDHEPAPTAEEVTGAFWLARHGDQHAAAEYLLDRGADINWIGYDQLTPLDAIQRSEADDLAAWLTERGSQERRPGPLHIGDPLRRPSGHPQLRTTRPRPPGGR